MLEKIGLPSKPSLRGNTWVIDASHCQGCSAQFTFINRKHHCRRCGGIFCGSCTQQRMFLRGQGDSVRICAPCKTLEEAARFEMRHGYKNKASKGSTKVSSKEEEVLNQIIGNESKAKTTINSASSSNIPDIVAQVVEVGGDMSRNLSLDQNTGMLIEMESATPEELREQAVLEKQKYKTLKAEGKPEEALQAFKRGKELERQAGALEISIRKNRRMALSSSSLNNGESSGKGNLSTQNSRPKDDLTAELKELGWSDIDSHEVEKKSATMLLDGELSSLLKEVSQKPVKDKGAVSTNKSQSQVIAHKKKALELKRSGNLLEAKEELKRAKILEKKIEEEEFLGGGDDDSDDELSSLIRSMDDYDEHNTSDLNFSFDQFGSIPDDLAMDGNFEVTEEDMDDPEMASALKSLGWTEDTAHSSDVHDHAAVSTNELLLTEVQSLKREALAHKRVENIMEAMTLLKKAKTLEMEPESSESGPDLGAVSSATVPKLAPKSKLTIQRELIALKKKALTLRREGKIDESQEELEKAKVIEQQLEDMDKTPTVTRPNNVTKQVAIVEDGDDEAVTDQDMHDPSYLSLLKNLGWEDDNNEEIPPLISKNSGTRWSKTHIETVPSRKSKSEIQRELLSLKRKALTLRRQGEVEEADELLKKASSLEAQLKELEEPLPKEDSIGAPQQSMSSFLPEIRVEDLGKKEYVRLKDKSQLIVEEKVRPNIQEPTIKPKIQEPTVKPNIHEPTVKPSIHEPTVKPNIHEPTVKPSIQEPMGKPNIQEPIVSQPQSSSLQQQILAHKRRALVLKREGKLAEAKEELRQAKLLEKPIEEKVSQTETISSTDASSVPDQSLVEKKEVGPTSVSKPPLSSRDRFKIQQESLGHKRQALKLRREGKTAEADAEFELAKALESQLEELDSQNKTSEPVDDVMVEDFLDPMLLSALQSIGWNDARGQTPAAIERPESSKLNADSNDKSGASEKEQLTERIKAEKVKAVGFKRSGKQAEALDALRRAKMYEKKLQMLT